METTPLSFIGHSNDLNNPIRIADLEDFENEYEDDSMKKHDDIITQEEEDSFAGDFYRCGTDWSCLNSSSTSANKRLKQCNLFESWKLPPKTNVEASTSIVLNKKTIQAKKPQQQQRACPFYKKLPGKKLRVPYILRY